MSAFCGRYPNCGCVGIGVYCHTDKSIDEIRALNKNKPEQVLGWKDEWPDKAESTRYNGKFVKHRNKMTHLTPKKKKRK